MKSKHEISGTHPERFRCAILSELEADKAVDEQTPEDGCADTDVDGGEPLHKRKDTVSHESLGERETGQLTA